MVFFLCPRVYASPAAPKWCSNSGCSGNELQLKRTMLVGKLNHLDGGSISLTGKAAVQRTHF
jgi:hypothetical protein